MKTPTKDLFDDSTMSFGEHLEALRSHLIKALIGLVIAVLFCLWIGDRLVDQIRRPIDVALKRYSEANVDREFAEVKAGKQTFWNGVRRFFGMDPLAEEPVEVVAEGEPPLPDPDTTSDTITVHLSKDELLRALHHSDPSHFPAPPPPPVAAANGTLLAPVAAPGEIALKLRAPQFAQFQATVEQSRRAVTLNVQEAFMVYLKVSLVAGVILASPWIFYQLWQFVAAGLYPHERSYVYVFGTMSLALFLIGAAFCFYLVFPFVLKYLLGFNAELKLHPQIRLSEWISFAVILPLMFGVSFQLPLVMLFLERIGILTSQQYLANARLAILVIAIIAMILTPSDPVSMLLMFFPLIGLYFLGVWLCNHLPRRQPLGELAS
ncbi:twin-arginine translocase subunit TatC [Planctomicrobium sp. SH664]|uniref:twin-arginine translocase subunit TatC n=1 Tax=Planctomicrobium sp. SH664 TaxID=3448125 RepID=UPI003F5C2180